MKGGLARGTSKNLGPPIRISATVEASNFKFGTQLRFGTSLPKKTTFWTKIGGGLGQGSTQKIWDPLRISATAEASNFKFCTQIWFETSLPKKRRLGPNLAGSWLGVHPEKLGLPTYFCNH